MPMQTAERDVSVILRGTGGQHAASRRCMMTRILEPQLVGNDEVTRLLDTAAASTRKRAHLLLHADHQDQVQRLLIGLEPPTMVLEVKPGPYRPNEFAAWAPEEGEPASSAFVHWAAGASVGSKWR